MPARPRIALVPGEPAGIGPELCVRLAQRDWPVDLVAYADPGLLQDTATAFELPLELLDINAPSHAGALALAPFPLSKPVVMGRPDPDNARATINALLAAGQACIGGELQGMVTGPVHKANINAGGIAYTGTTELLADQAHTDVVMMLASPELRVALATTHLPLREVPEAITPALLERCIRITDRALRRQFGIGKPRIAVLGLNPHAGEDGLLGSEEKAVMIPVIERLRTQGFQLSDPLPADTAFLPRKLTHFDAVLAMYHDQGLPVLKFSGFERAVNITLGLPYPRVAVDHGTALELAGKGEADASSMAAAIELCAKIAARANEIP
ncbi:4-hydroxythreonine-4-phosphate dehydrogenase PdxA [Pseudomarimonas arenosa]|uniref:4-hydroxythreonine-4-phosphate dehydrogenase n=1 Tax=Pseudomarimonas arenosa TaxID=2774145 RepID=A0AAW3ZJL1_9GAMM|nr:4-hydroxythreonine-4-phosphate dehydrogenase PdxA [Pseudomarimonas arenosa]MBD8525953.1 4-hydroxythreonine-4-phosphate dehydrogenase PdxA [Pseudomarimonas arenosa]